MLVIKSGSSTQKRGSWHSVTLWPEGVVTSSGISGGFAACSRWCCSYRAVPAAALTSGEAVHNLAGAEGQKVRVAVRC